MDTTRTKTKKIRTTAKEIKETFIITRPDIQRTKAEDNDARLEQRLWKQEVDTTTTGL
jgi:hypothetical protein